MAITGLPTIETIQDFNTDAKAFTEMMTSNADQTVQTDSQGKTKKTVKNFENIVDNANEFIESTSDTFETYTSGQSKKTVQGLINEAETRIGNAVIGAGWTSVGLWTSNPTLDETNQYVRYISGGNVYDYTPLTLPYTVDSTTNPDPEALVGTELKRVNEINEVDLNDLERRVTGVGVQYYHGSNGYYVQDGDTVPAGTTHLSIVINSKVEDVAISPVASGVVSLLTETGATIGGTPVTLHVFRNGGYQATNIQLQSITPRLGEQWFNTTDNSIHMGDGVTQGGIKQSPNFDSVADMKANNLIDGMQVTTKSYSNTSASDVVGGAVYKIVTSADYGGLPDEMGDHTLLNGNIAVLQLAGRVVDAAMFGGSPVIYVSTTGDDSNPGNSSLPKATIAAAAAKLKALGSYFIGSWVIDVAAGTYSAESAAFENISSEQRIEIRGPDVSGGTPTAILDGTGATEPYGLDFVGGYFKVTNIKTQNYDDIGSDIGIRAREYSDLWADNCHAEGCDFAGISAATLCRLRVYGGNYSNNNQFGIRAFGNTGFQIGTSGEGVTTENNVQANFIAQDGSQGTLVDFTSEGSQSGVNLRNQSSARLTNCNIDNATVAGVYAQRQSRWNNNSNIFGPGNAAPWIHETYSTEVEEYAGAIGEQRIAVNLENEAHTGDTALTLKKTLTTIKAGYFTDPTKRLRARIAFSSTGVDTKSISLRLNGNNLSSPADIQAGTVDGVYEVEVFAVDSANQRVTSNLQRGSVNTIQNFDRTINCSVDVKVNVYVQLADASDSITVKQCEVFLLG